MAQRGSLALAFAAVLACTPLASPTATTSTLPPQTASPSARDRVLGWRADLADLIPGMARLHPSLEHSVKRAELDTDVAALSAAVPSSSDDQLLVGLMRIVAKVSARGCDGHTGLYVWGEGTYPVDSLPLRVWWFDEGVFVVDALPPYRDLIGSRVDAMNGHGMREVLAALDPLVPRDNAETVRLLTPRFLLIPQVLHGLGIASAGPIALAVAPAGGPSRSITVAPIPMKDYNAWAGAYGLHLPSDPRVLYLARGEEPLWWTTLDGGALLYVQYNRVNYLSSSTFDDLRSALRAASVAKIVVDIRHNYGGDVQASTPLLTALQDAALPHGHLFVITGRNTFSAATMFLARLHDTTGAIVVGEPMGGCPNPIGNAQPVSLRFSGIVVMVATRPEIAMSVDDQRLTIPPDLPARLTPAAWLARQDPALAAIRAYQP